MRLAAGLLVLGVLSLLISSSLWLRSAQTIPLPPDRAGIEQVLDELEHQAKGREDVELAARYAGRRELLDPRLALPVWHTLDRDSAVAVNRATRSCPPAQVTQSLDAALSKVLRFQAAACDASAPSTRDDLVEHAPFLHPSGRSYAALALERAGADVASRRAFIGAHVRFFHVLELASLGAASLDPESRALAEVPASSWEAIARGDRLLMTPRLLVVAQQGPFGVDRLRIHPRGVWEALAASHGLTLAARSRTTACSRPASPELCWETTPERDGHRARLRDATLASGALVLGATFALGAGRVRERQRHHADRIHALRTLRRRQRIKEPIMGVTDELCNSNRREIDWGVMWMSAICSSETRIAFS